MREFKKIGVCNAHFHHIFKYPVEQSLEIFRGVKEYFGYDRIALMSLTASSNKGIDPANNLKALYFKKQMEPDIYACSNLWHWYDSRDNAQSFLQQAKRDWEELGFDGFKMLDGKPGMRKKLGCRLDDPIFDLYYQYAQDNQIPITLHLGDPKYFWDITKLSSYELEHGWFCDDTFPTLEELRGEVDGVLRKFPHLCLTLAHFYFMYDEIERCASLFDKYENLSFDLTLVQMLVDFSEKHDDWREFFIKYKNRLIVGTDNYNIPYDSTNIERVHGWCIIPLRTFLETRDEFEITIDGKQALVKPFDLDDDTLKAIYHDNFVSRFGETPRKICSHAVLQYADSMLSDFKNGVYTFSSDEIFDMETENLKSIIELFKKQ